MSQRENVSIEGNVSLDVQLTIEAEKQVVNVESEANHVSTDPTQNGDAIVLGQKELATLSDDPDELSQQLQAMAGPGAGPAGGQIYIDGFTGGNIPPKSSIREIRISSNPFSSEYDRPGFGRIEIFTKPGTDVIRGQAFMQFNDQYLNSRSPLLTQSNRPDYSQKFYGLTLTGPLKKQKASFTFDFERRDINENAFIIATTLDDNLNPKSVNQTLSQPQTRTSISPRIDHSINTNNTLTLRYQSTRVGLDNEGVGSFNLSSQAYNEKSSEDSVQATETAVLSARALTETRFQYMHTNMAYHANDSTAAISVEGAFTGGGTQIGNSQTTDNRWELSNTSSLTLGKQTLKWGGRVRQVFLDDTSLNNFGGTYTFFGGTGSELNSDNQPIPGTSISLTALEVYRRTLLFERLGYSAAQIRMLGGGASQFSLNAGTPTSNVNLLDAGFFFNDDWRLRPNLTVSYGLRYETQTLIRDHGDWAPRVGIAWGIDGHGAQAAKTVLRTGFGIFYDRVNESNFLQAERYNGTTQQSYLLQDPDTYPTIPSVSSLTAAKQPQSLQILSSDIVAPRTYQWNAGVERQFGRPFRLSANYIGSRAAHVLRSRNINTPIDGLYPFGDQQIRELTESVGFSRTNMLMISPMVNYKKFFLFGFYGLSYGKSDAEGQPADPYNLKAEWGPSSFGDVRHRLLLGTSIPAPWKLSISPFMMISSGTPFNITTGRDALHTGTTSQRPSLDQSLSASACTGSNLVYEAGYGCFNLNPALGTTIERDYGRGPMNLSLNLRVAKIWAFGRRGESGSPDAGGPPPGMGGARGAGGPPPGAPPPGGGPGGGPGGPGGMFAANSGKKYNLTLSASTRNFLNHPSYAAPSGDLSSPYFGQYLSLAGFGPMGGGNTTYDRKIDIQLRFQF